MRWRIGTFFSSGINVTMTFPVNAYWCVSIYIELLNEFEMLVCLLFVAFTNLHAVTFDVVGVGNGKLANVNLERTVVLGDVGICTNVVWNEEEGGSVWSDWETAFVNGF